MSYSSFVKKWDLKATVRSRPRRTIKADDLYQYQYPISRQPIAVHPLVRSQNEEVIKDILTQTALFYLSTIASIEVQLVNYGVQKVLNKTPPYDIPESMKLDLLSVLVDEAYHAHVAKDYCLQLTEALNIAPFYPQVSSDVSFAIDKALERLDESDHDEFWMVAICIGEHTLTDDIVDMGQEREVSAAFNGIMRDHMADEGRHVSLFRQVLNCLWPQFPQDKRERITSILPRFVQQYLSEPYFSQFNRDLLLYKGFSVEEADRIIKESFDDTNPCHDNNSSFQNIKKLLTHDQLAQDPLLQRSLESMKQSCTEDGHV